MYNICSTKRQLTCDEMYVKNPSLWFFSKVALSYSCKMLEICLCKLLLKPFRGGDSTALRGKPFQGWYAW